MLMGVLQDWLEVLAFYLAGLKGYFFSRIIATSGLQQVISLSYYLYSKSQLADLYIESWAILGIDLVCG